MMTPLDLLNSLGIAGPNIRHRLETAKDRADPKRSEEDRTADAYLDPDDEWCVCGRIWPCEALALDTEVRRLLAIEQECSHGS